MKKVARLLNDLCDAGLISGYALFGAMAQMRYTQAVATLDADVLVLVPDPNRLDLLSPIYDQCRKLGYHPEGEAVRVGNWPVQFIPAYDALTEEAVREAETADYEGVPLRVVDAVHLAVIALSVGRAKDYLRVLALIQDRAVTPDEIGRLATRHGLSEAWRRFQGRFPDESGSAADH